MTPILHSLPSFPSCCVNGGYLVTFPAMVSGCFSHVSHGLFLPQPWIRWQQTPKPRGSWCGRYWTWPSNRKRKRWSEAVTAVTKGGWDRCIPGGAEENHFKTTWKSDNCNSMSSASIQSIHVLVLSMSLQWKYMKIKTYQNVRPASQPSDPCYPCLGFFFAIWSIQWKFQKAMDHIPSSFHVV